MCRLLILLLLIPSPARPWSDQKNLVAASYVVSFIDWGQTLDISSHPESFHEINPIMGAHPSRAAVNNYFLASTLFHTALLFTLPDNLRTLYLKSRLIFQTSLISNNAHIGIQIHF
jgi:hypothetical protein